MRGYKETIRVLCILALLPLLIGALDLHGELSIEEIAHKIRVLGPYPPKIDGKVVDKRPELEGLIAQINDELESKPSDPKLLWLRGMAYRRFLTIYTKLESKDEEIYKKRREEIIRKYQEDYKKALQNASGEQDLPTAMVEDAALDVLFDGALEERANRYILEHSDTLLRDHEFALYRQIVTAYYEEGKYNDALRVLEDMAQMFPEEREDIQEFRKDAIAKLEEGNKGSVTADENAVTDGDSGDGAAQDTRPASPTTRSEGDTDAVNQSKQSHDLEAQEGANSKGMGSERWIRLLIAAGVLAIFGGLIAVWLRSRRAR